VERPIRALPIMPEDILHSARILAADDEEANLRLMGRILERAGCAHYTCTTDPRRVITLYREVSPDLVLLDLHMPGMDGVQVIEALRPSLEAEGYLPVLMISGDLTPEARQHALAHGARDFLSKPYDPTEAVLRIRNLLQTRYLHLQVQRQNRELEAKVAARTLELEAAQAEVLERLAQAAEFRDDDTGEHTRRVGALSALVAAALGADEAWVAMLRRAAPLHDVGKIGIPDGILLKPGRLSDPEMAIMRTHTRIGARILARGRSPMMTMAERIALSHHERWDGAGYPEGRAGEAIPLEARIVAVADFYDALTHDRPYRPAWTPAQTRAEIARGAGAHFDPQVAQAFLSMRV
jgi:putative two-component system response regulator